MSGKVDLMIHGHMVYTKLHQILKSTKNYLLIHIYIYIYLSEFTKYNYKQNQLFKSIILNQSDNIL